MPQQTCRCGKGAGFDHPDKNRHAIQ
jgi:hypothetical protein